MSLAIPGQTPLHLPHQSGEPLGVANPPPVPPEVELRQVAGQVVLAYVVKHPINAPLEHRPVVVDVLRMHIPRTNSVSWLMLSCRTKRFSER